MGDTIWSDRTSGVQKDPSSRYWSILKASVTILGLYAVDRDYKSGNNTVAIAGTSVLNGVFECDEG